MIHVRRDARCASSSASDFPVQPSQKDGLGRMCKTHWNAYTAGLARDAKARKAGEGDPVVEVAVPTADESQTIRSAHDGQAPADRLDRAGSHHVAPEPIAVDAESAAG